MNDEVWVEPDDRDARDARHAGEDREFQRHEAEPAPVEKMGYEGKAAQAQASVGDDLWDMHAAGSKIAEFTGGRSFEEYGESEVLQAAVASMLEVIAAALGRITLASPELGARLLSPELGALKERLEQDGRAMQGPEVWKFVREALPDLQARTQTELEAWHGA